MSDPQTTSKTQNLSKYQLSFKLRLQFFKLLENLNKCPYAGHFIHFLTPLINKYGANGGKRHKRANEFALLLALALFST